MGERGRLDEVAEKATQEYLRRSSITFLEAAISLMATHMTMEQVAAILREEAEHIEELG